MKHLQCNTSNHINLSTTPTKENTMKTFIKLFKQCDYILRHQEQLISNYDFLPGSYILRQYNWSNPDKPTYKKVFTLESPQFPGICLERNIRNVYMISVKNMPDYIIKNNTFIDSDAYYSTLTSNY